MAELKTMWKEDEHDWVGTGPDGKEIRVEKTLSPLMLTQKDGIASRMHNLISPITRKEISQKFKVSEELAQVLPVGTIISPGVSHLPNFRVVDDEKS